MANKGTTLLPGQFLLKEDYLLSNDSAHMFAMQDDGNLVLYRMSDHAALWSSGTYGKAVSTAVMQADGNFVIYGYPTDNSDPLWATGTNGPGAFLVLQDDGNVVIYEPDAPLWATNTSGE